MKLLWVIAFNTFREIMRDRILYGLIVFALILIVLSLAMGELTFTEQIRITANFGLAGIHLSSIILAIFVGSTLVSKEIDKKTILTLLARPITRAQFLVGKSFGLTLVILSIILSLAIVMVVTFYTLDIAFNLVSLGIGLYGIALEAILLLGLSVLLSSFTRPVLIVSVSMGVFLFGHWMNSLKFFAEKSEDKIFITFSKLLTSIFPDLERFNWRELILKGETLPVNEILIQTAYSFLWFTFFIAVTTLVLRRRDFG